MEKLEVDNVEEDPASVMENQRLMKLKNIKLLFSINNKHDKDDALITSTKQMTPLTN